QETNEPQYLFAEGGHGPQSADSSDIATMAAAAIAQCDGGVRSHWRTPTGSSSSGVLTTSIPADHGVLTITTLFKRIGQSTRMRASESAARLLPLVQPFFRTWLSRLKSVATLRTLTAVINNSDVGILLVDRDAQLIFANKAAETLIASGNGLRHRGTTIAGSSMTDTLRLHAAIEQAVLPVHAWLKQPEHPIIALNRRDHRPLMTVVVPNEATDGERSDCAAIIYIVDPDQELQKLIEPVCKFYHLSPAETRLACLLAQGQSLAEAAERLHLQEQTARSYLKQIFWKTNTNRQVELVRVLLLSAVHTGNHGKVVSVLNP
ncbi:MAG: PAS domain-containing protein, partial [Lysobacteraceae bacterium]